MAFWLAFGIGLWAFLVFCVICLCKLGARADRRYEDKPSPLADEVERWLNARDRTYARQGIQHLGKTRLGIDP